jgi:hypothetical protein
MMETKFTFKKLTARMLVVAMLAVFSVSQGYAQPSCACKTSVNVSLNASGQATITPEMVLADGNTCGGGTVTISETPTGQPIAGSPQVTCAHVGKTLYAKVTSPGTPSNSCWATLFVEDKIKPVINCPTGIQT